MGNVVELSTYTKILTQQSTSKVRTQYLREDIGDLIEVNISEDITINNKVIEQGNLYALKRSSSTSIELDVNGNLVISTNQNLFEYQINQQGHLICIKNDGNI